MNRRLTLALVAPLLLWLLFLALLPVFPSQDGPTHLMSGGILYDCIAGREPASSYYFWRSDKLTNQLCTLGLGLFEELGIGPRAAEGLWHLLLLALLVLVWKRMLDRVQAVPNSVLLVLLPFMGQVLHMGFYNFLAGVHLGLLAWTFRKPGWKNPASDVLYLLAVYSHPLGAATYLGLCGWDAIVQRRLRDLPTLLPHVGMFLWVALGNTGGEIKPTPMAFPDFFGATWIPHNNEDLVFLRVPLLLLLLLALYRSWPTLSKACRNRRLQLMVAGVIPLLATGFSPEIFGSATHLRIRAAYLGWILLLLALAPMAGSEGRLLLGIRQGLILALLAFNFGVDRGLALEIQEYMDEMPKPEAGATVLAGYDHFQPEFWPLSLNLSPIEDVPMRRNSVLDIPKRLHFDPWLHLPDRWAHEGQAVSLNDHQALYAHSPLGHRKPPTISWREGIEYKCSQLPLDELAGCADQILLSNLQSDWLSQAKLRMAPDLEIVEHGKDWILLAGGGDASPKARLSRPFFTQKLKRGPVMWPVKSLPETKQLQLTEAFVGLNAHRAFQVFWFDVDGSRYRPAREDEVRPTRGVYDGKGGFLFEHFQAPTQGVFVLVPR